MKTPTSILVALAAIGVYAQVDPNKPVVQQPIEPPLIGEQRSQGCFKSGGSLRDPGGYDNKGVTKGKCHDEVCGDALVMATSGTQCFCGNTYPPKSTRVDDSNCNFVCQGYPFEICGGLDSGDGGYWSVYNNGVQVDVKFEPDTASTSGSSSAPASTSSSSTDEKKPEEKKSSANVGGIAAGAVVGVLAIGGIIGGIFFYMRRKRNQEIEEEHRRNAAVSAFVGGKPPSSSGGLSITDSRLDPVMAQRRLSDGSIADNQDYSRKILRVTNA